MMKFLEENIGTNFDIKMANLIHGKILSREIQIRSTLRSDLVPGEDG